MKKKFFALFSVCILLCTMLAFYVGEQPEEVKQKEAVGPPEPLVINTVKPETTGMVTVVDDTGQVHAQYVGEIKIENDDLAGDFMDINLHPPDADFSNVSETIVPVVVYDRTNKAIVLYESFLEVNDGVLILKNADQAYIEHDCEWDLK